MHRHRISIGNRVKSYNNQPPPPPPSTASPAVRDLGLGWESGLGLSGSGFRVSGAH